MKIISWFRFWRIDMDAVRPLVKRILSFDIMVYLSNAHTITRCYNGGFIILIVVFSQRFLRTHKKWIFPVFHFLICIAISCSNIRYIYQRYNFHVRMKRQQFISIVAILRISRCKLRCKLRRKLREIVQNSDNLTLNFKRRNWQDNIGQCIRCHFYNFCSVGQFNLLLKKHL